MIFFFQLITDDHTRLIARLRKGKAKMCRAVDKMYLIFHCSINIYSIGTQGQFFATAAKGQ